MMISTLPFFNHSSILRCSAVDRNRDSISTLTGNSTNRSRNVLKCCIASTVVGTRIATCLLSLIALNAALNATESKAKGDILVFTDANAIFVESAVRKLVSHFKDPSIGLVCGHLKYLKNQGDNVGRGEGLYFKYESFLKRLESRWGAVVVVTGSIYAIRRSLWAPLEPDVANDFAHPVQVGAKGYKVVFEPQAI